MRKASPHCEFCPDCTDADYIAAQSKNQGKDIKWIFICRNHKIGWNDGADWEAPIYKMCHSS